MGVGGCPRVEAVLMGLTLLLAGIAAPAPTGDQAPRSDIRAQILSAEDRRAPTATELKVLTGALVDADRGVERLAVRALGRLERPELVASLAPMLQSQHPDVRLEAANALAQAVSTVPAAAGPDAQATRARSPVTQVRSLLLAQLGRETDPGVRGVICESLGRLPYSLADDMRTVERTLVAATFGPTPASGEAALDADLPTLMRAVKGLESLLRQNVKTLAPSPATVDRLQQIAAGGAARRSRSPSALTTGAGSSDTAQAARPPETDRLPWPDPTSTEADDVTRVRTLALLALATHAAADEKTLLAAMDDDRWEVRRLAVRSAGAGVRSTDSTARSRAMAVVMRGMGDTHWRVRYEALSALARNQNAPECRVLLTALADPNQHVSLLAVDSAWKCGPTSDAPRILGGLVRQLPSGDGPWHRPAHALVSLARLTPEQAEAQLGRFLSSRTWQVRAYAARAATIANAGSALRTLAMDGNDNVRTAAVSGLSSVEQHAADAVFMAELARDDGELLMTAARALAGTAERDAARPALLAALARLTKPHRDTSRDVRLALLERIGELGTGDHARAIGPYVHDFDPRVARAAAAILKQWTGIAPAVPPPGPPSAEPPAFDEVERLRHATAIVRMKKGGSFTLALLADDASASVVRFARLARTGYYNGLTFHRVEPGSLIQGGSPGANEYSGDGPFMRDELGLASNRRGTVGISTRGRDTGDAQWYINLVDNARYDHNYTVFAVVTSGMDVVDGILEGDAIEEVRIVDPPGPGLSASARFRRPPRFVEARRSAGRTPGEQRRQPGM